ncbi:tripartite tricarboxylate transporter TctB family protein [Devosia beringensis]|uniref:tripartite tricarboxylate transporter TctB family protein n=1 Tax=Devosia beringensis TaxID=2657486 RepID=UPI00186B9C95|nr:tripartite tricarboxylate transporter TctB family protein [Devosia beringensis]
MFRRDVLLVFGLLVVCGVVALGSANLRTSSFEPLGPAAFPLGLASVIACLSLVLLVQSCMQARYKSRLPKVVEAIPTEGVSPLRQSWLAAAMMALAIGFGVAIGILRIDFALASAIFLLATMTIMTRFRLRSLPLILAISAATAFGSDYLFTKILVINLP